MGKANILLVEDSKSQAETTRGFLERSGYDVVVAEDGKIAIKEALQGKVDVVILDLVLPDMSGLEVCRWLKVNNSTRMTPILMLTAKGEVTDKVMGLESGADDYLSKPYSETELNARIYALLRTKALQDELKEKNVQLEKLLSRVETLAITDSLTGLFNRRHIETFIEKEFKAAYRYDSPLACLMIDIDFFKKINDDFGHQTGDSVLKEMANVITNNIREVDTAARWGGEEFVVLLPRCSREDALISASRLLEAVAEHVFTDIEDRKVTISIGIAGVPDPSVDTAEKFIDASDRAMYAAKNGGRNRIEIA
jgi:diguanylate cyclase (GGDEF)-like protein